MTHIDTTLGNILIKHHDTWRGAYYLKDDMTFTTDRASACRFYLLKPGDTSINNGDRVSINSGNRILIIDSENNIILHDRSIYHDSDSFIISNGTDNLDPITYEGSLFFIINKEAKKALRYDWQTELIENTNIHRPTNSPTIITGTYGDDSPLNINSFRFFLEKANGPIVNIEPKQKFTDTKTFEIINEYKGIFLIVLLMMILALCVMIENGRIFSRNKV